MERKRVYELIDGERAYQQAQGHPDNAATPTRWLDAIDYYTNKAWSNTHDAEVMANIRKIAALAVAALEQYGCPPREGYDNPAPSEAMVGVDWSSAPAEAMFYAINSGGVEVYFEYEPIRYDADGYWDAPIDPNKKGRVLGARWQGNEIDLPLGVDWRTTLQRRPAGEGV